VRTDIPHFAGLDVRYQRTPRLNVQESLAPVRFGFQLNRFVHTN
jgi:hypothetical protein